MIEFACTDMPFFSSSDTSLSARLPESHFCMIKPDAKLLKQSTHAYVHTHESASSQKVAGKWSTACISITSVGTSATYSTSSSASPSASSRMTFVSIASSASPSSTRRAHAPRQSGTQSSAASSGVSGAGRRPALARRRAVARLST